MLRDLRKNISDQIQIKQIRKQKLFDEISKIDSDLLELNEILVKIGTDDAFFRISPNEAFEILESLGYKDNKEKLEMYVSLLTNEDKKVEKKESKKESEKELNFDKYIKICEKNLKNNNISSEKNKKFNDPCCQNRPDRAGWHPVRPPRRSLRADKAKPPAAQYGRHGTRCGSRRCRYAAPPCIRRDSHCRSRLHSWPGAAPALPKGRCGQTRRQNSPAAAQRQGRCPPARWHRGQWPNRCSGRRAGHTRRPAGCRGWAAVPRGAAF